MERLNFNIKIDATKEKIWDILLGETTYPKWTAPFAEGSSAVTDWQVGSKTLFLNAEGDGMVATIAEHIPNEYISIHHLGFYKNGLEDYDSEEVKKWSGAQENYKLSMKDDKVLLSIELDTDPAHRGYFDETWPKALEKVKELAEG